uniref:VWFA domain-containing protein n=1 Tax=Ciona savignyi TaxID=51511 RepID=H2YCH0_CIOSA
MNCTPMVEPVTCQPHDVVFLVDRTSEVEIYNSMLDFVKNFSFPLNFESGDVQVGAATFYSRAFKSVWLRNGRNFDSIERALSRTRRYGPVRNSKRRLASALRWIRERFIIPSQGKSRDSVPTSVVVILSGPSHDVIFNELLTYHSRGIDLTFINIGQHVSLTNSSSLQALRTAKIINISSVSQLESQISVLTNQICPKFKERACQCCHYRSWIIHA